ncbi:aldose epimerase family protein [Algivirga pacifica]|uniref:Aldose 1-epimerase n=1 Tax=Algivirga pacifica TaxID=1162670 RepID=A0ABP9D7Z8_9BACT
MNKPTITKSPWSEENVYRYHLENEKGTKVTLTNYGAHILEIFTVDKEEELADITLGVDTLEELKGDHPFFGSTVGRFANRIANGKCQIDGKEYSFAVNNGPNHLHGGPDGFHRQIWESEISEHNGLPAVKMTHLSPDGHEGYPGNLQVTLYFTLSNSNQLAIYYQATTDKETVINLTNHAYFNLSGKGNILQHELMINADHYTPVDKDCIPTGERAEVIGTPFDFTTSKKIGMDIKEEHPQIIIGNGYDHNFVLNKTDKTLSAAAEVTDPASGRFLKVQTTELGMQLYTANGLGGTKGKGDTTYEDFGALCLETQNFPDAPNQENFPSAFLKPGETYEQVTIFEFGTIKGKNGFFV